ncbi:MAG: hypothetical protein EPN92_04705, partial [Chitinophagaceae bacterium]
MKRILISGLLIISFILCKAQSVKKPGTNCELGVTFNGDYSKAATLDSIMKSYAPKLLPGVLTAVYSEKEGWWAGTEGYADVEKKILMQNCHLQYLQ